MTFWISALLIVTGLGAGLRIRAWRGRRATASREREVEKPNSSFSAPGVRVLVDLERWEGIPLEGLHPINRDEVDRLLQQARATGSDTLSVEERRFLDNMVRH